jgi:hypothetical protein
MYDLTSTISHSSSIFPLSLPCLLIALRLALIAKQQFLNMAGAIASQCLNEIFPTGANVHICWLAHLLIRPCSNVFYDMNIGRLSGGVPHHPRTLLSHSARSPLATVHSSPIMGKLLVVPIQLSAFMNKIGPHDVDVLFSFHSHIPVVSTLMVRLFYPGGANDDL